MARAAFYPLLIKPYDEGPNPIFAVFLRMEADMGSWAHAVNWFLPAEFLQGILIASILYPLYDTLKAWPFLKWMSCVASSYLVLGFWAATVSTPGDAGRHGLHATLYNSEAVPQCSTGGHPAG